MNREQFLNEVTWWTDLFYFCDDMGFENLMEDVYDDEAKDTYLDEHITDIASSADSWQDLLDMLQNVPTGYDFYILNEYEEFVGADDYDFNERKAYVLEYCDDSGIWGDEYEVNEDDNNDLDESGDEEAFAEEGCSLEELFEAGALCARAISEEMADTKESEEKELTELFDLI